MPTTTKEFNIGIKSSSSSDGEWVKVTNLTKGGTIKGQIKSGECVLNPSGSNTWENGDIVSIEVHGRLIGGTTKTISKGGATATISTSADAGPQISL